LLEIRAGEGGEDAKNFVHELASVYVRYATKKGLDIAIVDTDYGSSTLEISGKDALAAFENESGKHVVQRCPPSERSGRRHTSTVSVGVLPLFAFKSATIRDEDIEITFQNASGPGGQGVNTCKSACRMKHIPTGIAVKSQVHRSPQQNKAHAYNLLCGRVQEKKFLEQNSEYAAKRKKALGETGRGGARRTYCFYKNFVSDHVTGRKTNDIKEIMKGNLDILSK
jgi:peptide chain release factor 1